MPTLPVRPDLDHLRKQAKELVRQTPGLRLHQAQFRLAREYGFASWPELAAYVTALREAPADRTRRWLHLVYAGDVTGTLAAARPGVALRLLREQPGLLGDDPYAACAAGDAAAVRAQTATDPGWVNRPGGPFAVPPLLAVTMASLARLPECRDGHLHCARDLLQAGADPNGTIGNRYPPASLAAPDAAMPLSALYGAAGVVRDPAMTALLLEAGADPNDGESLYHSLEDLEITRLLLRAGAVVAGTNAVRRALDMPDPAALRLLLSHGGDPNEAPGPGPAGAWGAPLLRAIALRQAGHAAVLLEAGADPNAATPDGIGAGRLALQCGMTELASRLGAEAASDEDAFVAACARGDVAAARVVQQRRPDLPASLPADVLRLLPDTVAWGDKAAARVMVELGWPVAARGADWDASALNLAVSAGDAALTAFLLAHGAHWTERQGYGDDVLGTLSWVSVNVPDGEGDWPGCAAALRRHGLPPGTRDGVGTVTIEGRRRPFSEEVAAILAG